MPQFVPGQPLTASILNNLAAQIRSVIVGGQGIIVKALGTDRIVIEATNEGIPRMLSGSLREKTAQARAGLEAMVTDGRIREGDFCRTTGTVKRAYRYVGGELICNTHMEDA